MNKLVSNIQKIQKTWDKINSKKYREVIIVKFKKDIPLEDIEVRKLLINGIAIYL